MLHRRCLTALLHLLALWFLLIRSSDAKDDPKLYKTDFPSQLTEILYFDDSDVVLATDLSDGIIHRSDDAGKEWNKVQDPSKNVIRIVMNPHHNKVAVALGMERTHWITKDRGKTWDSFETEHLPQRLFPALSFHADDPDYIIINTADPMSPSQAVYTTDGFKSIKTLREKSLQCLWAREQSLMDTGSRTANESRTLCLADGRISGSGSTRLVISDDYFRSQEIEPTIAGGSVTGFSRMAAVKGYIVAAHKEEGSTDMAFFVTTDTTHWHKANFGTQKIHENAFTVLESTNYSLQVDVMIVQPDMLAENQMGYLFSSDSNGTYFSQNAKYTNRDRRGFVDFEKVQNIQGIIIVNVVDNPDAVLAGSPKKIRSQISFDDGRTMHDLKADDKTLHLHSVTDQTNSGRIFSSPAPGIVMGVGNTGDYLMPYTDGDLYVSDDAGLTWSRALEGAHKYEFGDSGSVLVAVYDEGETDELKYSIDHGKKWNSLDLGEKVRAQVLTTLPDSTSLKFILMAVVGHADDMKHRIFSIDFDGLHERDCKEDDFEKWHARVDSDGKARCVMGHTQTFRRRKASADCFINKEFVDPTPETSRCECTDVDFECDWGFVPSSDRKECESNSDRLLPGKGECADGKGVYKRPSGWRLIPGNVCTRTGGKQKDDPVEQECKDKPDTQTPPSGENGITTEPSYFTSVSHFVDKYYLNDCAPREDGIDCPDVDGKETIIALTQRAEIYLTDDHGKNWKQPSELKDQEIIAIYPHTYSSKRLYLLTESEKVWFTEDRGKSWNSFKAPSAPYLKGLQVIRYHPKNENWLLWTGDSRDESVVYYSTNNGDDWKTMAKNVGSCEFMWRDKAQQDDQKLVFCEQFRDPDEPDRKDLVASSDWFETVDTVEKDMIRFATMAEFIIVAKRKKDDRHFLELRTSVKWPQFADAKFPESFTPDHQTAYTALDSSTHAIFLHVTTNDATGQEYGNIVKSNSNGTWYVLSIENVNRNGNGYVDFEKMLGLEGVAMVNVVDNAKELKSSSEKKKKLKSMITHNDGADWKLIPAPEKNFEGHKFDCDVKNPEKCSLHLHSFTERKDPRDTFSSPSAIGLMIGAGNVGEFLGDVSESNTYITRDGGITWSEIFTGKYQWEYGDMGSVIVLVEEDRDTNILYYSNDEGSSWTKFRFAERPIRVNDLTTVPSDSSRNFLIWGTDGSRAITINVDFTGQTSKKCVLDESKPSSDESDYVLWAPKHPTQQDDCLFGRIARYHRKKPTSLCYNRPNFKELRHVHDLEKNCSCTRTDYECDYNYQRQSDGSCDLIQGLKPVTRKDACSADSNLVEWAESTGYRRIPIDTCEGGLELDKTGASHPCPGHEKDYAEKHGISAAGLFFAIFVPISVALGVGYWAWRRYENGKLGQIRLGDSGPSTFDPNSRWVTWPVMAISALAAALLAIPIVFGSIYKFGRDRFGRGRSYSARPYTSRASFGRGRGIYTPVSNDESDLLGDDSDDEA